MTRGTAAAMLRRQLREMQRRQRLEIARSLITRRGGSALSNQTDRNANTVHHGTAGVLVRNGEAELFTGPDGGRWIRMREA